MTSNDAPATEPSLRERKKQQTWEAIHQSARKLVSEKGLGQVTVGDICASAGVSDRTFFNYFPSKAEAALGLSNTGVPEASRREFLAKDGPLVEDLCALVAGVSTSPKRLRAIKELVFTHPDLTTTMHQWMGRLREDVIAIAEERATSQRARAATALVFTASFLHADPGYSGLADRPTAQQLFETVSMLAALANEQ